MYHDVTALPTSTGGGAKYFSVSNAAFVRHLGLLEVAGLRGCSIEEALGSPATRRVAISMDDGDLGQATRAFPALAARRMTATFFVTTNWVGTPGYASWDQLREMRAAGMSIQSHTHTHPFLSSLGSDLLRDELARSRSLLDEQLGQQTNMIAFPGGDAPRPELRHMLADQGYAVVGTSRWGLNDDAAESAQRYIRRCTVRGETNDAIFMAIATGNAWLGAKKSAREGVLRLVRSSLGPGRYARWRRALLETVSSSGAKGG